MLENLELKAGTLGNQGLLNQFNSALNDNYGNLAPTAISQVYTKEVIISAADIVQTGAGKLGHASGVVLVQAPGTGHFVEFLSATLSYDFGVAGYTAGGAITVNMGSTVLSSAVSAANSLGQSADKVVQFYPLQVNAIPIVANTGLNLVAATAFTDPGTAVGTVKVHVSYRIHTV